MSDSTAGIVGTWHLVTFTIASERGVTYPFGKDPVGLITYTADGHVHVAIMRQGRPAFAAAHMFRGTDAEIREATEGHLSYSGTYRLVGANVIHDIVVCSFPNWIGTQQLRHLELQGDRLTLRIPVTPETANLGAGELVLRRAQGQA